MLALTLIMIVITVAVVSFFFPRKSETFQKFEERCEAINDLFKAHPDAIDQHLLFNWKSQDLKIEAKGPVSKETRQVMQLLKDTMHAIMQMNAADLLKAHQTKAKGAQARINLLTSVVPIWRSDFAEIRLHKMDSGKTSSHHNHGYNQVSFNVQGGYVHELFSWNEHRKSQLTAESGKYRLMRRCGSCSPPKKSIRIARGNLSKDHVYTYSSGQAWALDYRQIHDLHVFEEGCWTVNFRVRNTPEACTVYNKLSEDGTYERPEWLPPFLNQNLELAKKNVGNTIEDFVGTHSESVVQAPLKDGFLFRMYI